MGVDDRELVAGLDGGRLGYTFAVALPWLYGYCGY